MSMSDPLANMIAGIKNAQTSKRHKTLEVPYSNLKKSVLSVLKSEGYISDFEVVNVRKNINNLKIVLKTHNNTFALSSISKVSKPGLRVYFDIDEVKSKPHYNGLGIYILSTPKGVMSNRQALLENVGGEVLCKVF